MNTEKTLLSNSNIANEDYDLSKLNIRVVECNSTGYKVILSISEKASQKWHIYIPINIDFLKEIQCNIAGKDVTKEEFQFYRKMIQVAYALSVYFIDVKNNLEGEVLSGTAFSGEDFYEYAEKLFKQIHIEITNRSTSMGSKL